MKREPYFVCEFLSTMIVGALYHQYKSKTSDDNLTLLLQTPSSVSSDTLELQYFRNGILSKIRNEANLQVHNALQECVNLEPCRRCPIARRRIS